MATKNHRLKKMLEIYLNEMKKFEIETMYGKGSKVIIHTFNYSITNKSILVESVIILGDLITEEVLDRSMVEVLIQDVIPYFFPNIQSVKVMTRWDV